MIRNYLPNIQVVVPSIFYFNSEPIGSTSHHPTNNEKPIAPPPTKSSSRPAPKTPAVSYASFPVNK